MQQEYGAGLNRKSELLSILVEPSVQETCADTYFECTGHSHNLFPARELLLQRVGTMRRKGTDTGHPSRRSDLERGGEGVQHTACRLEALPELFRHATEQGRRRFLSETF